MNYDEASTSTETKMDSAAKQVQQSVDCAVQDGEEHPPYSCIEHLELKNRSTVCARESNPPLLETRLLEMSAVDIDMFENVVVTMPAADGNNNEISMGPVSSNKQVAVSSQRKKLDGIKKVGRKKLSKGTGAVHAKEVSKNHSRVVIP